jgi:hypothetical protein
MTLGFRPGSQTSAGNSTLNSLTVPKGAGVVDNDDMVVVAYLEPDTNTWATVPSGWTSVFRQANAGAFNIEIFVKRAASEPASWTWIPATTGVWQTAVFDAYSGGTGTGTILDLANGAQADAVIISNQTAPSIVTTVVNDMLIFGYGNFSGADVTATTGAATNLRVSFGGVAIADAIRASAGATGTTAPLSGPGSETYAAIHAALISDTGSGASVVIPAGTPTWPFPHPPLMSA